MIFTTLFQTWNPAQRAAPKIYRKNGSHPEAIRPLKLAPTLTVNGGPTPPPVARFFRKKCRQVLCV